MTICITTQKTLLFEKVFNRPLAKLPNTDVVQGASGTENPSVHAVFEDAIRLFSGMMLEAIQPFTLEVE